MAQEPRSRHAGEEPALRCGSPPHAAASLPVQRFPGSESEDRSFRLPARGPASAALVAAAWSWPGSGGGGAGIRQGGGEAGDKEKGACPESTPGRREWGIAGGRGG